MIEHLISDARERGCTEISLDATQMGHPVYSKIGFTDNTEGMTLTL